jgi:uncharacterized coiled-coil protein SlyX
LSGDINKFIGLDQNWPVGAPVSQINHNYNNVIGWIRKKGSDMPAPEGQREGIQFPNDPKVYVWAPDPTYAKSWFGDADWGKYVHTVQPQTVEVPVEKIVYADQPETLQQLKDERILNENLEVKVSDQEAKITKLNQDLIDCEDKLDACVHTTPVVEDELGNKLKDVLNKFLGLFRKKDK